jgi:outer membrane receptor protein involved in Fe transport
MKSRLLATSVFAGVAVGFTLSSAIAQEDDTPVAVVDAAADDVSVQETVVVTGSLIPQSGNLVETSPVTTIGSEEFDVRGTLRAEDIINTLPQAFGAQGAGLANGSTGTASVNLRGLGAERTLVLLNGRRLPYGTTVAGGAAPDINFIPSALVKRVDVLTGGASATYGSDAISGVVNFVLDKDFEGLRIDTNYSFYQHKNNNDEIQGVLAPFVADNPSQFRIPDSNVQDGESIDITAMVGGNFDNGRGHISSYAGYQNVNEVLQGDRDYAQCALGTANDGNDFTCSGSSTNQFANILDVAPGYVIPGGVLGNTANVDGTEFVGPDAWARVNPDNGQFRDRDFATDTFNFNPFNHFQRPNERYTFGTFIDYEVSENANVYGEFMLMDNRTNSQIAPSGVFGLGVGGDAGGVNCNNPFLSAQQVQYLCGELADNTINRRQIAAVDADGNNIMVNVNAAGVRLDADNVDGEDILGNDDLFFGDADTDPDQAALAADGVAPILILRRNVEGGARNQDIRHTTYRGVIGMTGNLGDTPLGYDISATYASVHRSDVYNNDLSKTNVARALNAVDDGTGNIVCSVNADTDTSNDDPNCVPYDIFSGNAPSAGALGYIVQPLNRDGTITQSIVSGKVFGSLGDFGISLPTSEDAPAFALGVEYRRDALESNPDANYQSGDGAGQGGPTNAISGSQEVYDFFGELNVPLVQNRPGVDHLGFDLAYRKSFYDKVDTDTYKIGVDYAPTSDVRIRGSYQRAVRAANIFDLFTQNSIGLVDLTADAVTGLFDPCATDGGVTTATFEQCARTGVTAAQYGNIADNPAGQFNNFTGGNVDLDPETADTFTIGFVATPTFIEGLTFSVDYFDIEVEDYINTVPESLSLSQCLETGDDFFCSLINRGSGGTLWANQTGFITATNVNTGSISTKGFDMLANYTIEADAYGSFNLNYVGTILDSLEVVPLPSSTGDQIFDCAGSYGGRCQNNFGSGANPEYRHKAGVTWTNADGGLSVTGTWRYFDEVTLDGTDGSGRNGKLDKQNYFDLSARYNVLENTTVRAGVNNILDEDPPLSSVVGTAPGNGNTYPQVYDALGRYFFVGASVDF